MDREWPFKEYSANVSGPREYYRQINDIIHSSIGVYYPVNLIIDTLEFQRLRDIKQLGFATRLVYPSADHSRFTHSLGVYHLAFKMVERLRDLSIYNNFEEVSTIDMLCVCIAALVHDIGHGPFSHFYEKCLSAMDVHGFKHEQMSCQIFFDYMLSKNVKVKKALDAFLTETDYTFIRELIDPPKKFMIDGNWQLKGRAQNKSFLYDIVSNKHAGVDVDKFDYLLRDSLMSGFAIKLNKRSFERIIDGIGIMFDKDAQYHRISYLVKNDAELFSIFISRMELHKNVYQHKTCLAYERMLIDILKMADPYISFSEPTTGNKYHLSELFKNIAVFVNVNDSDVISQILHSTSDDLKSARMALEALNRREIPKRVRSFDIPKRMTMEKDELRCRIKKRILSYSEGLRDNEFFIEIVDIHSGFGIGQSPLKKLLFDVQKEEVRQMMKSMDELLYGELKANVYLTYNLSNNEEKNRQLRDAAAKYEEQISKEQHNGTPIKHGRRKLDDSIEQDETNFLF